MAETVVGGEDTVVPYVEHRRKRPRVRGNHTIGIIRDELLPQINGDEGRLSALIDEYTDEIVIDLRRNRSQVFVGRYRRDDDRVAENLVNAVLAADLMQPES